MRRSLCGGIVALVLLALPVVSAVAQETGTPVFKAPYRAFEQHEFGASLSDPGEGAGIALEGFYRFGKDKNDFSVRAGVADGAAEDNTFLIGGDFRTQVLSYSESFPLDGSLTVGFGGIFGDGPGRRLPAARRHLARPALRHRGLDHDVRAVRAPEPRAGLRRRRRSCSSRSVSAWTSASASSGPFGRAAASATSRAWVSACRTCADPDRIGARLRRLRGRARVCSSPKSVDILRSPRVACCARSWAFLTLSSTPEDPP